MKKLIVEKESSGIRLSRTNTDQTFLIENSEIFGLILDLSEATNYDPVIINAHSICLEAARKYNS